MKSIWKFFSTVMSGNSTPASRGLRATSKYPNTFKPRALVDGLGSFRVPRPEIFEPALRHFSRAYRLGDPSFTDPGVARRWQAARRAAARHVLRVITRSEYAEHLVLRGSFLLRAWFGDAAREPRDLDWVVQQPYAHDAEFADELFNAIARLIAEQPLTAAGPDGAGDLITFDADGLVVDDIWAYDRFPGRRVLLPWRAGELPAGTVQLDVAFGERLRTPAVRRVLPGTERHPQPSTLWAADMAQSLAWKVQWLVTDQYPQGKDLYDATLLAEHVRLPYALLREVMVAANAKPGDLRQLLPQLGLHSDVKWDDFRAEYPWITGSAEQWQTRLATALAPTLAEADLAGDLAP